MIRIACIVCLALAALSASAAEYDRADAVKYSQAAIGRSLGDFRLRDTLGQSFELSSLRGRPLVISMIYTSCHHVCPTITQNLAATFDVAREALGDDAFVAVTIGFDWQNDTPDRMLRFAAQQGVDDAPNWHFLASDAGVIDELAANLGFLFYPSAKGFDHLTQTTIVDRNGVIYRQVYGMSIDKQAIVEPLKELVFDTPRSAGLIEHWISTLKLFCTVYDPNADRYRFDYSIFLSIIIGVLCLGAIAAFIVREWRIAR